MTKDLKLKIYPAVIGVLTLSLVVVLLSRLQITTYIESAPAENSQGRVPALPPAAVEPPQTIPADSPLIPEAATNHAATRSTTNSEIDPPTSPSAATDATGQTEATGQRGSLRVGNQTSHPVRVALLTEAIGIEVVDDQATAATPGDRASFREPVHWDFAPGEGSARGLLLSLPDGNMSIQSGDVVVVFAQDGSRRYWGPYVVGNTRLPAWNEETQEWQLLLRP